MKDYKELDPELEQELDELTEELELEDLIQSKKKKPKKILDN